MTTTPSRPTPPPTNLADDGPARSGFAARVSLGRVFAPVPSEFLLLASTALILTGFGLVMVLSATMATANASPFETVLKQAVFALLGIPLMFIAGRMPLRFWKRIAWPALGLGIALQLLVFVPGLGVHNDGNTNWISLFGFQAQPSEFLKLALAIWLGFVLYRKQTLLSKWQHVFIPVVPVGTLVIGTVMGGHDLGTAMILMAILLGCLFFSGVKLRLFVIPLILVVAAAAVFAVTSPNRMARIMSFLNVDSTDCYFADAGSCYQPLHGVWALASGGIFGLGLGNSREKYQWLPAAANDYIFAIVGEELGLIGCAVVLGLFALYAVGAFHIIRKTNDPFVRIVAGGITIWIVGQALINIGVVLRVFPVLGVPLPFMSQGGTSLVSGLLATGVLLSFARTLPVRVPALDVASGARPARPVPARAGSARR
ncbi:cell division protein FtsW [Microbacterium sp. AISO3]|uniref:Probable peptidoglycan glycosyltransferase FtsW n=2 Tax=Microbacterium TaxID=33882 RepID=A0ABU1HZ16_9MICO|nr:MULTISPECIES: putative lipid II flippase FtsW [Microbacterium]APF33677.1 putative lipid II flippase FtsW [Microbacterium paludicola]MDR6165949.1 cell division protein FtsW [Microbacterium paludicola]OAZ38936.1 cell division protein FtsW [Microbacterium arborescens]OWP22251.1 cell division protein FtsW [Microbacterium sp. AISO3]QCR39988.1 putative lipid II flippase FtsW [Microbacterium sp. SGAir0570]